MVRYFFSLLFLVAIGLITSVIFVSNRKIPTNEAVIEEYKRDKPVQMRGSIPYWDQEKAFASCSQNASEFDYVSLFWYFLAADGKVKKYQGVASLDQAELQKNLRKDDHGGPAGLREGPI